MQNHDQFTDTLMEGVLQEIPLDDLVPSKYNTYDTSDYSDLMGNIASFGILTPLTVIGPDENGKYSILSGERRFKAARDLVRDGDERFKIIPCLIKGGSDMETELQKLCIESSNLETREFDKNSHCFNIIKILKEMSDSGKFRHSKIVKEAGKYMRGSDRYRRMYLTVFEKGGADVMQLVKDNALTINNASRISNLNSEAQKEITDMIKSGTDADDAIKSYKQNEAKRELENTISELLDKGEMSDSDVFYIRSLDAKTQKDLMDEIKDTESAKEVVTRHRNLAAANRASIKQGLDMEDDGDYKCSYTEPQNRHIDKNAELFFDEDMSTDDMFTMFANAAGNVSTVLDASGEYSKMTGDIREEDEKRQANVLKTVISWGKSVLKRGTYSEEEYEAIEICKEIADMF